MLKNTSGNILEVGDKVKINIEVLEKEVEEWGGDGIEFSSSGKNYLRYAQEHPDEVYTVTDINFQYEEAPYILSGYMGDNNWSSDELICIPEPKNRFEVIKNMTLEEMSADLIPLVAELCEDGIPSPEYTLGWLQGSPFQGIPL